MKNNKFFIRQYSFGQFFHGGIGYSDAEKILLQKGFAPVTFPHYDNFTIGAKIGRLFYLIKMFFAIRKGAYVVFLFPVFAKMSQLLLRLLRSKKDVTIICLVADIDGIKDGNKKLLEKEIEELKQYRYFIVHNDSMRWWLLTLIPSASTATIEFFDFLAPAFVGEREKDADIVFAGNLAKSSFLEQLYLLKEKRQGLHFNLYGPGCTDAMKSQRNVTYKGTVNPYDLPAKIEGCFGLVWDGDCIDKPGGSLGDYMLYISHHKLSLYILSGLPLIVPETAASARIVKKYFIGITINSLHEIEDRINDVSAGQYQQMRKNMKPLAEKISKGNCLGNALKELMKEE